jgi:BlaI family penicillinase repressor
MWYNIMKGIGTMRKEKNSKPTAAELEILQILWQQGPCTVRDVHEQLNTKKQVGYTTTLKIMQNMAEKAMVKRTPDGKRHIYQAALKENDTQSQLLDKFLHTTFAGSASRLVMQTLGNYKTSREELSRIRSLLDKLEGEEK